MRLANLRARTPVGEAPATLPPKLRSAAGTAQPIALRALPATPPRVLVIGSSTGGPQALNTIVSQIGGVLDRAPVLITQHMPPTFTTILAEHLARLAKRPVREAQDGEEINAGAVYLAPGGRHMSVARRDGTAVIALDDGPLINFCKPAVDPLFSSAAQVWGNKLLGLVLTGMGSDGLRGSIQSHASGGRSRTMPPESAVEHRLIFSYQLPSAILFADLPARHSKENDRSRHQKNISELDHATRRILDRLQRTSGNILRTDRNQSFIFREPVSHVLKHD